MILKDLEIGDKFYPKSRAMNRTPIFTVLDKCVFNSGHGSSTRLCLDTYKMIQVSKSCRLEVIKIEPKQ